MEKNFGKLLLIVILFFPSIASINAQSNYGNEWIVSGQNYWKIKVLHNGLHRLHYNQLASIGFPVNGTNPQKLQLFWRGMQVPIFVQGQTDGSFDPTDFIEFIGQTNDGALDSILYKNRHDQVHTFHSLFTDTSYYFLTIGQADGIRFLEVDGTTLTDTIEQWHMSDLFAPFTNRYSLGVPIAANATLSDYTFGEGWVGGIIGLGGAFARNYSLTGFVRGVAPVLAEVRIFALSNAAVAANLPNHHISLAFSLTNNTTPAPYLDTTYKGYTLLNRIFEVNQADIANNGNTRFRFDVINDLGVAADNHSLSSLHFKYPRNFNLNNTSTRRFSLTSNKPQVRLRFTRYDIANKTTPLLYDITNNKRIKVDLTLDSVRCMVQLNQTVDLLLTDSTDAVSPVVVPTNLTRFDPTNANFDYLIITNDQLLQGANDYANYRRSTVGGGFNPLVITTQTLYDQFYYGCQFHPMAIRNFAKLLLEQAPIKPQYLLLLGKGFQATFRNDSLRNTQNMVPSFGVPASDNLLTAGLDSTIQQPAIPTGRIAAFNNNQIQIYLNKLIAYESTLPQQWQKEVLHVSGGVSESEKDRFSAYLNQFASHLTRPSWGARLHTYDKNTSNAISVDPKTFIQNRINQGIGLYSYFGHGSASAIGVDFGFPSDLQNTGKYPVMLFNGCGVGDAFTTSSIGESYMFEPNKGAIAWLATSDLGFETFLRGYSDILYQHIGFRSYGARLGDKIKATITQFQNPISELNLIHCQQFIYQGDPALKTYNFDYPDFSIVPQGIYFSPRNPTATTDSFVVKVIINNFGKAVNDSLSVRLVRTLPDGNKITLTILRIPSPLFRDTVHFTIIDPNPNYRGLNRFEATVDVFQEIAELDKNNNTAFIDYFMPTNGVNLLYPLPFATVNGNQVKLQAQSGNMFLKGVRYFFELDTSENFNSSALISQSILPDKNLAELYFNLLPGDSVPYFWRARLDLPIVDGGGWETRSFLRISQADTSKTWVQKGLGQLSQKQTTNLVFENSSFEYEPVGRELRVGTSGFNTVQALSFRNGDVNLSTGSNCGFFASAAIVDPISFFSPSFQSTCNNRPAMNFQVQDSSGLEALAAFIDTIPTGYHFMFATFNRGAHFLNTNAKLMLALASVGADTALIASFDTSRTDIAPRISFAMVGTKGMQPGMALQDTAISIDRQNDKGVLIRRDVFSRGVKGSYFSEIAGPATSWESISYDLDLRDNNPADSLNMEIWGIDRQNNKTLIAQNVDNNAPLNALIDAKTYPYLEMRLHTYDSLNRTAPQVKYWAFKYRSLPETTVIIDADFKLSKDSVQQGDSLTLTYKLRNLSTYRTDTLSIKYTIVDENRNVTILQMDTLNPLEIGQQKTLSINLNTRQLFGKYDLIIESEQKSFFSDLYDFNNLFQTSFRVFGDPFSPVLDVTFDGVRILNGDLVSSKPQILIQSLDENTRFPQNDTSLFEISIRKPGSFQFERLYFSSNELIFEPANGNKNLAKVYYNPTNLIDGTYDLSVQVSDASQNSAGLKPYQISFKVINKTSISQFYTYPNPFSTQTRFVYTLTGSEIPEDILIKIYTVTGKVVREINKLELGNIRIGNNISDFRWDGTDQFGDQLANGVYFYRVEVRSKGKKVERFETAGDKFFEKEIGKIYLMR